MTASSAASRSFVLRTLSLVLRNEEQGDWLMLAVTDLFDPKSFDLRRLVMIDGSMQECPCAFVYPDKDAMRNVQRWADRNPEMTLVHTTTAYEFMVVVPIPSLDLMGEAADSLFKAVASQIGLQRHRTPI